MLGTRGCFLYHRRPPAASTPVPAPTITAAAVAPVVAAVPAITAAAVAAAPTVAAPAASTVAAPAAVSVGVVSAGPSTSRRFIARLDHPNQCSGCC